MAQEQTPREAIDDLVDDVFDRIQPQFVRYEDDERRQTKSGGVMLAAHESMTHNPEHTEGRATLRVSRVDSRRPVVNALLEVPAFREIANDRDRSHVYLATNEELGDHRKSIFAVVKLKVSRETHPQGHDRFSLGLGEFWGAADYDPNVTGLRRRIGANLTMIIEDEEADKRFRISFEASVQSRFDRDPPQAKVVSNVTDPELVGLESNVYEEDQHEITTVRPATIEDAVGMAAVFATAKDLRVDIDPIRSHLAYQTFVQDHPLFADSST